MWREAANWKKTNPKPPTPNPKQLHKPPIPRLETLFYSLSTLFLIFLSHLFALQRIPNALIVVFSCVNGFLSA
jgi:hypothetical protein